MAGQNPIVRAEHVVKLMHGIDDRLDLAYIKEEREELNWGRVHVKDQLDLPSDIIFAISANNSAVIFTLSSLLDRNSTLSMEGT